MPAYCDDSNGDGGRVRTLVNQPMTLPPAILEQIFGASPILTEKRAGEKRRKGRFPFSIGATLCAVEAAGVGKPMTVRVRDLSGEGIGIVRSASLRIAEHFVIGLPQKGHEAAWIECEVVRSASLGGGLYLVGATFYKLLKGCPFKGGSASRPRTPNTESSEMERIRKAILC